MRRYRPDDYISSISKAKGTEPMDPRRGIATPDGGWLVYPEEAGELVGWEDEGTFRTRKGYSRYFHALIIVPGILMIVAGIVLLLLLFENPLSEAADGGGYTLLIGAGFFLVIAAGNNANVDCNTWRTAFFTHGIGLLLPQIGHWELFFVSWAKVHTCKHVDHWHLGPILMVGYGGQRLFVLRTTEGFDRIEQLLKNNTRLL